MTHWIMRDKEGETEIDGGWERKKERRGESWERIEERGERREESERNMVESVSSGEMSKIGLFNSDQSFCSQIPFIP